jgi:hypothetical protein
VYASDSQPDTTGNEFHQFIEAYDICHVRRLIRGIVILAGPYTTRRHRWKGTVQ